MRDDSDVPACIWLTGAPGAGKTTIAAATADAFTARDHPVVLLDDDVRAYLTDGVDPLAWLCRELVGNGVTVIAAIGLPKRADRDLLRSEVPDFVEVFVDGGNADGEYEEPLAPDLRIPTRDRDAAASSSQLVSWLEHQGLLRASD